MTFNLNATHKALPEIVAMALRNGECPSESTVEKLVHHHLTDRDVANMNGPNGDEYCNEFSDDVCSVMAKIEALLDD